MKNYPWYLRFWVWWIILTALYLGLQLLELNETGTFLVGIFVPIGFLNGIVMFSQPIFGVILVVLVIYTLYIADANAVKWNIRSTGSKILYNLGLLLLLTLVIDLVLFHTWQSMAILTGIGGADFGF